MKTSLLLAAVIGTFLAGTTGQGAVGTNSMALALQQGLFEEEANNNLDAAIQAYKTVVTQFDRDRKLAATAIYRMGECYRKQGKTNEAVAHYKRIVAEFSDIATMANLSRQNLAGLGAEAAPAQVAGGKSATPVTLTGVEEEEIKRIRAIIQNSPDLINAFTDGSTPLQKASMSGQVVVARFLLENGALVNVPARAPNDKRTALQMAAKGGHRALLQLLIEHKADINAAEQREQKTALHFAASEGFLGVVETLITAGANVKAADYAGTTPLHSAAAGGHAALAELLIKHGADVNASSRVGGTPLLLAAEQGHSLMVTMLLRHGAMVNLAHSSGRTPLIAAVDRGHLETVKVLLANKADPNLAVRGTDQGEPSSLGAIHLAVASRATDVLRLLLENGANPNLPRTKGQSMTYPLAIAIAETDAADNVKLLLDHGADPNLLSYGEPPLIAAIKKPQEPAVELLLQHKADVNLPHAQGVSPLHCSLGQPRIFQLIIAAEPNINATNDSGQTPLHWAISSGLTGIADQLIGRGANVNARDKQGLTPLHYAVLAKDKDMLAVLLKAEADPNIRDASGNTPLDIEKNPYSYGSYRPAPGLSVWQTSTLQNNPIATLRMRPPRAGQPAAVAESQSELAQLLRKHGALDVLPDNESIKVGRQGRADASSFFKKGTNDWNRFTLLEALGAAYRFLDPQPDSMADYHAEMSIIAQTAEGLGFPNLSRIQIRRPSGSPIQWTTRTIDVAQLLESGDCSKDVTLEWGDVVEIPEADHLLNEPWKGFSLETLNAFNKCWTREVEVIVKGKSTKLTLKSQYDVQKTPGYQPVASGALPSSITWVEKISVHFYASMWIKPVLKESKLLLSSSDLSRIKVTRTDPATGEKKTCVVDCSEDKAAPDFWLRNGDIIEVPDKE